MTREEAIAELREDKALYESDICHAGDGTPDGRLLQAIDMAIEALSAEAVQETVPTVVRVTMSDGSQYYLEHESDAIQADTDDLIIKGAKGIQDGLYNIKDGKLFQYKAKGGTVRTYPIIKGGDDE